MIWRITTDELLERYNAGERNFNGIELIRIIGEMGERDGVDGHITGLAESDLREISLRGANLQQVDFTKANLTEADLFGAYLHSACLCETILFEANLQGANLYEAYCEKANFVGANLDSANLEDGYFCEADFGSASLSYMNASHANFQNAKMPGWGFERANLTRANFHGANCTRGDICCRSNLIWNTIMPNGSIEGTRPYIEQHPYMYGNREISHGERIFL